MLRGIEPSHHGTFLAELNDQFHLAVFDLRAAALAAMLFQQSESLPKEAGVARACIKADILIVASAKVAGATQFYSHEPRVRKLAVLAGMEGKNLPTQGSNLWTELDMKLPPKPTKKKGQ